jgi:hypothetical protein
MSHIIIKIDTDNAAFEFNPCFEVARILSDLAQVIENDNESEAHTLRDYNGNRVGLYESYS